MGFPPWLHTAPCCILQKNKKKIQGPFSVNKGGGGGGQANLETYMQWSAGPQSMTGVIVFGDLACQYLMKAAIAFMVGLTF